MRNKDFQYCLPSGTGLGWLFNGLSLATKPRAGFRGLIWRLWKVNQSVLTCHTFTSSRTIKSRGALRTLQQSTVLVIKLHKKGLRGAVRLITYQNTHQRGLKICQRVSGDVAQAVIGRNFRRLRAISYSSKAVRKG